MLKIQIFTGKSAKTYIPSLAKLRVEIFQEYPFLQPLSLDHEMERFKRILPYKETIVIIVFDGPKIVGVSVGLALKDTSLDIQKTFLTHGLEIADYFYFGESVLLKAYRGRGVSHHFFELREKHAKSLKKFKHICFSFIKRPKKDPKRPSDYIDLETFWKKRGYIENSEITLQRTWKDIGASEETTKIFTFWFSTII